MNTTTVTKPLAAASAKSNSEELNNIVSDKNIEIVIERNTRSRDTLPDVCVVVVLFLL